MNWRITEPQISNRDTPNYGAVVVEAITATSTEIVPVGTKPRFASISSTLDSGNIYVSYGIAVDVATNTFNFIIPPGFQNNKMEIPAQAVHAACATGETATLIIGISE